MRGFWLKPKARKRQADGHVSNDHFFWSWSVTNVVRRTLRISLWKDVFGTRQREAGGFARTLQPVDQSVIRSHFNLRV